MTAQTEVFFDGACPLCRREIEMLRRFDSKSALRMTDIASPTFVAPADRTKAQLMGEIHARRADGTWITGVDVFAAMYRGVGWNPVAAVLESRPLRPILNRAYEVFARNRLRWTGRANECDDGVCHVPAAAK